MMVNSMTALSQGKETLTVWQRMSDKECLHDESFAVIHQQSKRASPARAIR